MKVVVAHNFYGSEAPSGENQVYGEEIRLLRARGHGVIEFTRHSDKIRSMGRWGTLVGGASTPWNPFAASELRRVIKHERPDIVHVHNFFPMLSPAILYANARTPTAMVLTLHNYRLFCAAGIPMRDKQVCTRCLDERSVLPALRYGCYRGSRTATLPIAGMIGIHRALGTWHKAVDAFIALTPFQRDTMVAAGLPSDLITIKPHFARTPPAPVPWHQRENKALYVGRLGPEKGVSTLIRAWELWGETAPHLDIIGDGPERNMLEAMVAKSNLARSITFKGQLPFSQTQQSIAEARLLVVPSLCFEGFPMVVLEAYALGVAVAASRLGSLPGTILEGETGRLFQPGDAHDLYNVVHHSFRDAIGLERMSVRARLEFDTHYTADRNHSILIDIYNAAVNVRRAKLARIFQMPPERNG